MTATWKIKKIHNEYITINDFSKCSGTIFGERLIKAELRGKDDIPDFVKKTDFDKKPININKNVNSNKTKHVEAEKKLKDLSE